MILSALILFTALCISAVAAYYSMLGLVAIFPMAVLPIILMSGTLEVGKILTTVWLHQYWHEATWKIKTYLCAAVMVLMLLTSLGVFGFLSKAHTDQAVPAGANIAAVAFIDEKITSQQRIVDTNLIVLKQLDNVIDQYMARTTNKRGVNSAVWVRKKQKSERKEISITVTEARATIATLRAERVPLSAKVRKNEADIGPIKYVAALIYDEETSENTLEKAVRFVIIMIVFVFDPFAITLILAATQSIEWARDKQQEAAKVLEIANETKEFARLATINKEQRIHDLARENDHATPEFDILNINAALAEAAEPAEVFDPTIEEPNTISHVVSIKDHDAIIDKTIEQAELLADATRVIEDNEIKLKDAANTIQQLRNSTSKDAYELNTAVITLTAERDMLAANITDQEAINIALVTEINILKNNAIHASETVSPATTPLQVDYESEIAVPDGIADKSKSGFGTEFPKSPTKGEVFLRVDQYPPKLFKWNGKIWISVAKSNTDVMAYNNQYIEHLIKKLASQEYTHDELSEKEQERVALQLSKL